MVPELNSELYNLIIRQLDGSASQEEEAKLQEWLKEDPGNQEAYDSIKELWEGAAEAAVFEKLDIEADWQLVKDQTKTTIHIEAHKPPAKIRPMRWAMGIAAGLALVLLSYLAYLNINTEQGIHEIALSDGSKVWLNKNAEFDYPKTFSGAERTVSLKGEAFFEIAQNPDMPFVINTAESQVKVLGTSFNVKTDASSTEVIVATGTVELYDTDNATEKVILTKGLKGLHQGDSLVSAPNENVNYLAWKTGIFTFEGTPVLKALNEISAISDKPAHLESGLNSDCLLRANFDNESILSMLETVALSCGLKVKTYENAYVLSAIKE